MRPPHDDELPPLWQLLLITLVAALVLMGIWFGYHVAFGRLATEVPHG